MDPDQERKIEEIMGIYRRASRADALALARSFQTEGRFQYFRGQTHCHLPRATFHRLDEAGRQGALESCARLEHWVDNTPGLEDLRGKPDSILAVAQHYGFPTPFLDFTTDPEVAAYFATCVDGQGYTGTDEACIFCLNMDDLDAFLKHMPDWPKIEMLRLTVPNLWRIESQCGVFLWCPVMNLDHFYGFTQIIFPQTKEPPSIHTERIYPRKSNLEILLDEYAHLNRSAQNNARWEKDDRFEHVYMVSPIKGMRELLKGGELPPPHASWDEPALMAWLAVPVEAYSGVLPLEPAARRAAIPRGTRAEDLSQRDWLLGVIAQPGARLQLLDWGPASDLVPSSPGLGDALNRIWDGMRSLPYTDGQIAAAMRVAVLLVSRVPVVQPLRGVYDMQGEFSELFGPSAAIEVGTPLGGSARALVPSATLRQAVRDDIGEFVDFADVSTEEGEVSRILQAAFDIRSVYRFDRLCDMYAEFVIPVQVIANPGRRLNLFCPARLDVLGLP